VVLKHLLRSSLAGASTSFEHFNMAEFAGPGNTQEKESLMPALFAIIEGMKVARHFVRFIMTNLQQHVKNTLKKEDLDCSGCSVFDVGPMCFSVESLDAKTGVFTAQSEGHLFDQSSIHRIRYPVAITFSNVPDSLAAQGVGANDILYAFLFSLPYSSFLHCKDKKSFVILTRMQLHQS
jgi:hypothetical protein